METATKTTGKVTATNKMATILLGVWLAANVAELAVAWFNGWTLPGLAFYIRGLNSWPAAVAQGVVAIGVGLFLIWRRFYGTLAALTMAMGALAIYMVGATSA